MNKVLEVHGSLNYDDVDDSSDSDDENENNGISDAPMVFKNDSDDEELEVFESSKKNKGSLVKSNDKNPIENKIQPVEHCTAQVKETGAPLSLLTAMQTVVQEIENEVFIQMMVRSHKANCVCGATESDMEFSRQDANLQKEEALRKKNDVMSGSGETFDFSSKNSAVNMQSDASDIFGISYKPFMPKKNSYELPKGPAFEDEVEFEKELLKSSTVTATTLGAIGKINSEVEMELDDEFDFDESKRDGQAQFTLPAFEVEPEKETSQKISAHVTKLEERVDGGEEDFRESSKKALEDIKDVYSSGLGDHEISLLNDDIDDNKITSSNEIVLDMTKGSVIEEIDEEELEREEEEEERLKQEKLSNEKKSLEALQSQWENIANEKENATMIDDKEFTEVKYIDVEKYFRGLDLSQHTSKITVDSPDSSSWSLLSKSSKLSKASIPREEIEFPFLIAQVDYSPEECPEHLNFLRNIYKALVTPMPCLPPRVGGHWENIGFQGMDPSTDINRSMKMLSVLQVFHLLHKEKVMTERLYNNSLGNSTIHTHASDQRKVMDTSWPFMCVAIGMTKNSIDALRAGVLTKYAIRYNSALEALHEYHHACFYCLLKNLISNPHIHHAEHLNAIRKEVSNNPLALLRAYRESKKNTKDRKGSKSKAGGTVTDSTSMHDINDDNVERSSTTSDKTSRRSSWKQLFSSNDTRAKKFMAEDDTKAR